MYGFRSIPNESTPIPNTTTQNITHQREQKIYLGEGIRWIGSILNEHRISRIFHGVSAHLALVDRKGLMLNIIGLPTKLEVQ